MNATTELVTACDLHTLTHQSSILNGERAHDASRSLRSLVSEWLLPKGVLDSSVL